MSFYIQYDHFEYQIIRFGLFNFWASFQGYINKIMAKKLNIFIIINLDDIFIYIKDLDYNHVETIRVMLDVLRKHTLFAKLKKCQFHKDKICFLGYIILA